MKPRACVAGWPIRHSRSPIIHGYWLKQYGIEGEYRREAIPPENIRSFLSNLSSHGYVGCNVTIPHKEAAFEAVASADEATRRLKVVNTVFLRDGRAQGTSTDGEGFLANLLQETEGWSAAGKRVVVLGAGGAARAIVGALLDAGTAEICVVNRSLERARALQTDFGPTIKPVSWTSRADSLIDTDLLINTTSLGMTGQPDLELPLDRLPNTAIVADIVYTPLETTLLKRAKARGHRTAKGLGMLLHQAVRGFELWFGVRPEVTPQLYDLVAADIESAG